MPGLLDAFKQYVRDALPGGALNREVTPQGLLDAASIATIPVPVVGDVTGLAADLYRMRDPQERTPLNIGLAALGALPLVPPVLSVARKGDKVADVLRAAERVPAPQEAALETARRNAVKMLGLPENNTAMDRARALGFETPAVHFSRHGVDVNVLDSGKFAIAPFDAVGTHVGTPEAALERFMNTAAMKDEAKGVTYPVLIKNKRPFTDGGKTWGEERLMLQLRELGGYDTAKKTYPQLNAELRERLFKEFDAIPYVNDVEAKGKISYIVPPQNIRSRFAAFDPARINENDLLGRADPALLAILAGGGLLGGGAYYLSDK